MRADSAFHSVEMAEEDATALRDLEEKIGEEISSINKVGMYRSGFVHRNRAR